jgi:hypothetical protein
MLTIRYTIIKFLYFVQIRVCILAHLRYIKSALDPGVMVTALPVPLQVHLDPFMSP